MRDRDHARTVGQRDVVDDVRKPGDHCLLDIVERDRESLGRAVDRGEDDRHCAQKLVPEPGRLPLIPRNASATSRRASRRTASRPGAGSRPALGDLGQHGLPRLAAVAVGGQLGPATAQLRRLLVVGTDGGGFQLSRAARRARSASSGVRWPKSRTGVGMLESGARSPPRQPAAGGAARPCSASRGYTTTRPNHETY